MLLVYFDTYIMSIFIEFVKRFTLINSKYLNIEAMALDVEACIQKFGVEILRKDDDEICFKPLLQILSGMTSDSFQRTDTAVEWSGLHHEWETDEFYQAVSKLLF